VTFHRKTNDLVARFLYRSRGGLGKLSWFFAKQRPRGLVY